MSDATPGQAERERFAAKMEMLAGWFDADDFAKGRAGRTEVQEDLRRWAAAARDLAVRDPHAAPAESSALGLRLAVTSNRLGHALAALREVAGRTESSGQGLAIAAHGIARNALADDAAIRDNVTLTRRPTPELATAQDSGPVITMQGIATAAIDEIRELRAMLSSLTDRAEASGAITEDEADEYRAALGVTP
jgi:hypothetical protein